MASDVFEEKATARQPKLFKIVRIPGRGIGQEREGSRHRWTVVMSTDWTVEQQELTSEVLQGRTLVYPRIERLGCRYLQMLQISTNKTECATQ